MRKFARNLIISSQVGFFLAVREIKRSNPWTTVLIGFVMTLTFLNLIVIRGILVGLIDGSIVANKDRFSGEVILTLLKDKSYIEQSPDIMKYIESLPSAGAMSARYVGNGKLEAGYKTKVNPDDLPEFIGAQVAGVDPVKENEVTGLRKFVIEGSYLDEADENMILIGSGLLFKYAAFEQIGASPLKEAEVGKKVRLTLGGKTIEVTIKGVIKGKVDQIDQRIVMLDRQVRQMIGRDDLNVSEISIRTKPGYTPEELKAALTQQGFDRFAKIQTSDEAVPKFVKDIALTFSLLGNVIGTIGLVVATITIFIVIFVNAITRRKYIGILKGIGVSAAAIEISYIIQALFYALTGIGVGVFLVFAFIKPYFDINPINFPFSDGILVATAGDVLFRAILLMVATACAGFVPARLVVKQNTLDAILGR